MVKILLLANILFVSEYCPPCQEAKKLVPSDTKIIDIHKNPILANRYRVRTVPTYLTDGKRIIGLARIREYCNSNFTGVLHFPGPNDLITNGIIKRVKRFGFTLRLGTKQQAIDYKITHLPTFIFIKNGKEIGRYVKK